MTIEFETFYSRHLGRFLLDQGGEREGRAWGLLHFST